MWNIFSKSRWKMKRIHVYALVGPSGTGKSFRAILVSEKYNIDLMIDDGLLIRNQRILAGRSAKREKNRFTAIKRAIFEDQEHVREVKEVLDNEKFKSILILGISEKMAARIADRLGLPYPDEVIYIEDVATPEEILQAKESRKVSGKHIIPVPVVEVKQDPSHRILDSIKIFLKTHPLLFWKKRIAEKAIVQPPFSQKGKLTLSEAALTQMIIHCVKEFAKKVDITKIVIDTQMSHYNIELKLSVPYGSNIPEILNGMQDYIVSHIERFSGIHIDRLDLTVDQVKKK